MELKKFTLIVFSLIFNSVFISANQWIQYGRDILSNKYEPQVNYWINFIAENITDSYTLNDYGEKVYKVKDYTIIENGNNDDGKFSKGGKKTHTYSVYSDDSTQLRIILSFDEIILTMGINNKNIYWIIINKNEIKYKFLDYEKGSELIIPNP